MIIQKAYKFRFYPTKEQELQLSQEFGNARFVWNYSLALRSKAYAENKEKHNYVSLSKKITELKANPDYNWLNNSTSGCLTQKLIDLDKAYSNFFGKRASYPTFKKKLHIQSIRYQLDQRNIKSTYEKGEFLKIPKLGYINIKWSQIPQGIPKMATISKASSGKYFVSFMCQVEQVPLDKTHKEVGIDVGIKDVIVTSDGYYSGSPKFTYQYARKLRKESRKLSRKTKGSNRYNKQRIKVAKIHEKIANSRKDFLHKQTTNIIKNYDVVCLEDLNIKGMMKNRKLSKAIADVGLFELKRQIRYKATWNGKKVIDIDRFFPSTKMCSSCGTIHEMKLSDRIMNCNCGNLMDRDLNAAINIKLAGKVKRGVSNQLIAQKIETNQDMKKRRNSKTSHAGMEPAVASLAN
jgi:putative transposase